MNPISRRSFMAGAALGAASCRKKRTARPNILWLIAEDFCPDLGCYGNRMVQTPNLDRLAAEGVRFTRAFVTAPVCSPSRSAIAVGMYQTSIGAHHHRSHRDDGYRLVEGIHPLTYYFRQAGYHTSNVVTAAPGVKGTGKTDLNFVSENLFDGTDWTGRESDQPFYAQVNFQETHRSFRRFTERPVDPEKIELPPYYPDHPAVRRDWAMYLESAQHLDVKVGKVLDRLRQENLLEDTAVFFFADNGQPMPRGKQFLYEGGIRIPLIMWIPQRFRPEGFTPGGVREELVSAIDITATSLMLAGIEPPVHVQGQVIFGSEWKGRDYIVAARDRCDETVDRIRCVRTARFKYIRNFYPDRPYAQPNIYKDTSYPTLQVMRQLQAERKLDGPAALFMAPRRPPEELYDLEADPHEIHNLAESSEHHNTLLEMRKTLDRWMLQTGDQGDVPEKALPEEYKYRSQADGWCSQGACLVSKSGGTLRVQCAGKAGRIQKSYVTEGGEFSVRFRARSKEASPQTFSWGSIEDMTGAGNKVEIGFTADGQWKEHLVAFAVQGFLASLRFDFGAAAGAIEFDWIRLYGNAGGEGEPLARWEFA